jgi:hypothetical protein
MTMPHIPEICPVMNIMTTPTQLNSQGDAANRASVWRVAKPMRYLYFRLRVLGQRVPLVRAGDPRAASGSLRGLALKWLSMTLFVANEVAGHGGSRFPYL